MTVQVSVEAAQSSVAPRSGTLSRSVLSNSSPKVCPISRRMCSIQNRRFAFLCPWQCFERDSFVYRKLSMIVVYIHQWEDGSKCFPIKRKSKCVSLIFRNDYEDRSCWSVIGDFFSIKRECKTVFISNSFDSMIDIERFRSNRWRDHFGLSAKNFTGSVSQTSTAIDVSWLLDQR